MLGMVFRGIFLISVLSWYSTSVWKLIDGYFRDQFRSYLEEEYRKNPRMKSDVQGHSVDKMTPVSGPTGPDTTVEPQREINEVCQLDRRAVEVAENDFVDAKTVETSQVTGGTSENEAALGSIDKNAFLGTGAESGLESRKSFGDREESREPINHRDRDLEEEKNDDHHQSVSSVSKNTRKRSRLDKKPAVPRDIPGDNRSPKIRRNVKTITLTERDFQSTRKKEAIDDFWEFEEDAGDKEALEGILVSQLPFKPRADIGDLERITSEEYCPLTLEDEESCGETAKWP